MHAHTDQIKYEQINKRNNNFPFTLVFTNFMHKSYFVVFVHIEELHSDTFSLQLIIVARFLFVVFGIVSLFLFVSCVYVDNKTLKYFFLLLTSLFLCLSLRVEHNIHSNSVQRTMFLVFVLAFSATKNCQNFQ